MGTGTFLRLRGPSHRAARPALAIGAKRVAFETAALDAAGVAWTFVGDCSEEGGDISCATKTAYDAACAI